VLALGLAAYPVLVVHGVLRTTLGVLGLGAVGLLLGGLAARAGGPLPWSIGLLGVSAAVAMLAGGASVERVAPVWGPGLLLAAELAWWALDRAYLPREPAGVARRRALLLVAMAVAGVTLALLVILAGGLAGAASGLDVRVLGVGAAVMVAWTLAVLARRAGGR
jgi:hypothetical protein